MQTLEAGITQVCASASDPDADDQRLRLPCGPDGLLQATACAQAEVIQAQGEGCRTA